MNQSAFLRKKWAKMIFVYSCLLFVLWDVYQRIGLVQTAQINSLLMFLEGIAAGAVLMQIDFRKYRYFWPLVLFFPLVIVLCILRGWEVLDGSMFTLRRGLFLLIDVMFLGLMLDREETKRVLGFFIALWLIWFVSVSCIGIYLTMSQTGEAFYNLNRSLYIQLEYSGRLFLFSYYTVAGEELMASIGIALLGIALARKKFVKLLCLVSVAPLLAALAFTGSRSSYLCAGAVLGLYIALLVLRKVSCKRFIAVAVASLIVLAVTVGSYVGLNKVVHLANEAVLSELMRGSIASARAEESLSGAAGEILEEPSTTRNVTKISNRMDSELLSGRDKVWRKSFHMLNTHPGFLLLGGSIPYMMDTFNHTYRDGVSYFEHLHCMPLQILCELGIGGLALYVWFVFLFLAAAYRLFFDKERPMWERCLPFTALGIFANEMVDGITRLSVANPTSSLLMLMISLTFAADLRKKQND